MKNSRYVFVIVACLLAGSLPAFADDAAIERELDTFWRDVASYLAAGDFEGLASTYHPEAVLVSESLNTSYPITQALERWKPGILDTRAGKVVTTVDFRITSRLFSASTSHERGIFHYHSRPINEEVDEGGSNDYYVHFEALLLKSGDWTMIMEHQKEAATREDWEATEAAFNPPPAAGLAESARQRASNGTLPRDWPSNRSAAPSAGIPHRSAAQAGR